MANRKKYIDKKINNIIKYKFILLEIASVLIFILFIILISDKPVREDVSLAELSDSIERLEENSAWKESDAQGLRKYNGLSAVEYEDFLLYLPVMKDESQASEVKAAMESRLKNQKNVFESYGVDQMKLLNNAVISVKGRYALFAVCEQAENVEKSFISVMEGK